MCMYTILRRFFNMCDEDLNERLKKIQRNWFSTLHDPDVSICPILSLSIYIFIYCTSQLLFRLGRAELIHARAATV